MSQEIRGQDLLRESASPCCQIHTQPATSARRAGKQVRLPMKKRKIAWVRELHGSQKVQRSFLNNIIYSIEQENLESYG